MEVKYRINRTVILISLNSSVMVDFCVCDLLLALKLWEWCLAHRRNLVNVCK